MSVYVETNILLINQSYSEVVVVQLPSHVELFVTTWTAARQVSLSLTISRNLPKFMSIAIQPSHPQMPSSPSALNISKHQGLLQGVDCSYQVIKILEL